MNETHNFRRASAQQLALRLVFGAFAVLVFVSTLGLLISGVFRTRVVSSSRTAIASALKQMGHGVHGFHDQHKHLPPAIGEHAGKYGTVHFHILPYLEQAGVYEQNRVEAIINCFHTSADPSRTEAAFEGKFGFTNYAANYLALTAGPQKNGKIVFLDSFPDGISETVLFATRYQMCNGTPTLLGYDKPDPKSPFIGMFNKDMFQTNPSKTECNPTVANTWSSTMQLVMADASVHSVDPKISRRIWALALHPADGEKLPPGAID